MAESHIVLYGDELWESPYVFTAFVALQEKGLPFEVSVIDLTRKEQLAPDYRDRSLTARVPCIEHGGFVLSESLAIVEYLDDAFGGAGRPRLLPDGIEARARARQILGWLRSDLLPLRDERSTRTMFYERATAPLSERARGAADKLFRVAEQVVPVGEGHLFGAWSSADADLAFMLHRLILNGDAVPARIERWAANQWARPSVRAYVEHDRPKHGP